MGPLKPLSGSTWNSLPSWKRIGFSDLGRTGVSSLGPAEALKEGGTEGGLDRERPSCVESWVLPW